MKLPVKSYFTDHIENAHGAFFFKKNKSVKILNLMISLQY